MFNLVAKKNIAHGMQPIADPEERVVSNLFKKMMTTEHKQVKNVGVVVFVSCLI